MKKKISIVLVLILLISLAYSKTIYKKEGTITNNVSNSINKPNYILKIDCDKEDYSVFRKYSFNDGLCLVKEGGEVTINYSGAEVRGGGRDGSSETTTVLNITKSGIGINYKNPFVIQKNEVYNLILYSHSSSSYGSSNDTVLTSIMIIGIDESEDITLVDSIKNFRGYLCNYQNDKHDYRLSVYCENATQKFSNWPIWYVKKGESVTIKHKSYQNQGSSSGYNPVTGEFGGGGFAENSYLRINGITIYNETKVMNVEEDVEIELRFKRAATGETTVDREDIKVIIKVDDTPPSPLPTINGSVNKWVKENETLTATGSTDDKSGLSHYEYRTVNSDWIRGSSYTTVVEDGQILNNFISFRAVDNVGNTSEVIRTVVKIDKSKPVITADKETGIWTKDDITILSGDIGSGLKELIIRKDGNLYNPPTTNVLSESGIYTIQAEDNAGNKSESAIYLIDKTKPEINLNGYKECNWTNKDVAINFTDVHSGVESVKVNGKTISEKNEYKITQTGEYTVECSDKSGNVNIATVKIDKIKPLVQGLLFSKFGYESNGEAEYLNTFDVMYNVTEGESGIKSNLLEMNNAKVNETKNTVVTYCEKQNLAKLQRNETDETFEYKVMATDNAENNSQEIKAEIIIPRKIIIKPVEEDDENQGIRKSYLEEGYTINGILINKIDFALYKKIKLKRTFLGDKEEGKTRKEFNYEDYKLRFNGNVPEQTIKEKWIEAKESIISIKDVRSVSVRGVSYWYYEDKIKIDSGLGHRGIRYQTEWEWKAYDIREKGEYVVTNKSANNPGRVKIRIQGTDSDGNESRYMVLDSQGNKIEAESDVDFTIPASGIIRFAVNVEDEDFDDYNIEATELVKTLFTDDKGVSEEKVLVVMMKDAVSSGYIERVIDGGKIKSQFRAISGETSCWYEFENAEIKLYYNKPFNFKIKMVEGCKGDGGKYSDVTESGVIRLKAVNPDIGGFKLLVGEEAGYNEEGINARPHQEIELGIQMSEGNENTYELEWDYGDRIKGRGSNVKHAYGQSPDRTGNISEYKLTITERNGQNVKTASVNVHITDTQYGVLLGDEEWIGAHPVLGRIQVPEKVILTVKDNMKGNENQTVILGYGSIIEENRGLIEVLVGGMLSIDIQNPNGIKITEGRNGSEFTEVKTEKDGGNDESLKWGGIIVRNGAKSSYISNAIIKYAFNGICIEEDSVLTLKNTQIDSCSEYGLKINGKLIADNIKIWDSKKGMCVKGDAEIEGSIIIEGEGSIGIENEESAILISGKDITVKDFEKGIKNKGIIKATKKVSVEGSFDWAIRNEGNITAESLNVKALTGRGYICSSDSNAKFEESHIEAGEIAVHCTGNAKAEFGKSEIRAETYGIKTDRDKEGSPSIKIDEKSIIEAASVLWYDCECGVLTDEEIEERMVSN